MLKTREQKDNVQVLAMKKNANMNKDDGYLNSREALNAKSEADADMKKADNYVIKTPEDFRRWAKDVAKHNY